MIRRPPRSTLFSLHDALPICNERYVLMSLDRIEKELDSIKAAGCRSEEHTSELQSLAYLVCRLLLEKKNIDELSPPTYKLKHKNHHIHSAHNTVYKQRSILQL